MPNHHHRAGGLKQSNKRNKRSKASKRSINRAMGGRVNAGKRSSGGGAAGLLARSKADRRHMIQQKRAASRQAVLQMKRGVGGGGAHPPPRVIGIISLGESQDIEERLQALLLKEADRVVIPDGRNRGSAVTARYNVHKKEGTLTYLTNSKAFGPHYGENSEDAAVLAALDLCRICDMVLFVVDGNAPNPEADVLGMNIGGDTVSVGTNKTSQQEWDHLISRRGDRILAAVKGQGLPTPLTILAHTAKDQPDEDFMTMQSAKSVRRSSIKRKADLKHYVSRFATTEFGPEKDKVVEVDLTFLQEDGDAVPGEEMDPIARQKRASSAALIRTLCTMAATPPKWISDAPRSYLISESHEYDAEKQELRLTGYVRGIVPFDVNALLHVPNLGTYACHSVQRAQSKLLERSGDAPMDQDDTLYSDPAKQESLEIFAAPDALDGEQNLVGFDADLETEYEDSGHSKNAERPAGWSDYQSAWLDAVDDMSAGESDVDRGELARELNQKSSRSGAASVATGVIDMDEDNEVSQEERKSLLEQRRRDQKEDLEFPDEVQIQEDVNARDRFARYRSLKSFRKSHWDAKENLPETYGSIYHFSSFKATQRDVMAEMKDRREEAAKADGDFWGHSVSAEESDHRMQDDSEEDEDALDGCVPSGSYVTVTLDNVSAKDLASVSLDCLITAVSLLPHENKVSVLHMGLSQSSNCEQAEDAPVKSKDILIFRCGWRTWKARPVFSQHNLNSDKHKFERFLPQGGAFFAASVFGPVTYTPCPVLVFRERSLDVASKESTRELLAVGSMIGANADRIVVKRIILTGYPVRVHKRYATVKYMFYDPEDVKWFKPAGLATKHGLHGNIIESVGEHGTMKCLFNAPIKQHDTVCLPLYKRIYPKFAPADRDGQISDGVSVRTSGAKGALIIR